MSAYSATGPDATGSGRWSHIAERGSLLGMRCAVWCHRAFGRRAVLALAQFVVAYFFLTDRSGRKASREYLRRVWSTPEGRAALGRPPGLWQSFLHYRQFAISIVERLSIWFGEGDDFTFDVKGNEHADRLAAEHRGGIVLGAHLGSFDALRLLADRQQRTVNALMFTAHARRINAIFRELSPDAEARVIEVDPGSVQSVFEIRERVRRGELIAILGDRIEPGDRSRSSRVPFLGGSVRLPHAPFLLASLLGCPVLLMIALRTGPGDYEVFTEKLAERVDLPRRERQKGVTELLAAYAGRLEHYCKRSPYQWFNFYDYWGDETSSEGRA
jgi:predicted LPLAT superfamily acyltransferase